MKVIIIDYHICCIILGCHFFQSLILTIYEPFIIFEKKWSIDLFNFVYVDVECFVIHLKVGRNDYCFNEFQVIPNRNLSFVYCAFSMGAWTWAKLVVNPWKYVFSLELHLKLSMSMTSYCVSIRNSCMQQFPFIISDLPLGFCVIM